MASPLTGCKERELILLSTDKLDLIIKGKPCHPKAEALNNSRNSESTIAVNCKSPYSVDIFSVETQEFKNYPECTTLNICKTNPLFYEYQDYELIIESKGNYEIKFWHDNIQLRERISYVGKSKRILSGILNFGSEIGFSDLKIYIDGYEYIKIAIEIFPSKIDYQDDYLEILRDVNNEIYNLSFEFLKKTYLFASINENVGGSLTEFFSIINLIFDNFKTSVDIIIKNPHHVLQCENSIVPFHKIKKSSNATVKWLEKNPQNLLLHEDKYTPQKALIVKKSISFDTFENRFTKYVLKSIMKKLEDVRKNYSKLGRKADEEVIKLIDRMVKEIQRRIEFSFLKNVGDLHTLNALSLVLNMGLGYKDVYKYYLMLIKGLSLNGEIFKISVKDLAVLYEYWCFIKLYSLLKNKYKLLQQDLIKIDSSGLFITLSKGKKASVLYENPLNGEKFKLTYNPPISGLPTVAQRPDNVLSLEKQRTKIKYEYIFDAKYRINPAIEGSTYKQTYNLPGPEESDINTMHRYRDAIVYSASDRSDFERTMFGAYILFPYNDEEEYKQHRFYESISKVNVGGLPFLPSATALVEDLLNELIEDSPESAFERNTLPKGTYDYIESINFDERDVLVGALKTKDQLSVALQHKFYHIPYKNIKSNGVTFKFIALYQSEKLFGQEAGVKYYGAIDNWEIVKREEIIEIPKNSDEMYIRFHIKEWSKLNRTIKPKEYGVRSHVYTNKQLLLNSEFLPELCIKTKEEYRLYVELKRMLATVETKSTQSIIDNTNLIWFHYEGVKITLINDKVKILKGNNVRELGIAEFRANPKRVVSLIEKCLD